MGKHTPALDDLIKEIDQQIEQVPHPFETEGFEAFLGSQLGVFKKRGQQYIRFQLDDTEFALPLDHALEIGYVPEITPLPNLPNWVLGICNLRGDIVSVVDLKQIFDLNSNGAHTTSYLIIVHYQNVSTAILVDKIIGVFFDGDMEMINEAALDIRNSFSHFIRNSFSSNRKTIHLLNIQTLVSELKLNQ